MDKYFIRANVFGKIKYWDHINGLHSGRGGKGGYQVFDTEKEAKETVKHLKKCFYSVITWEVLPDSEIPFIKKQRTSRRYSIEKERVLMVTNTSY